MGYTPKTVTSAKRVSASVAGFGLLQARNLPFDVFLHFEHRVILLRIFFLKRVVRQLFGGFGAVGAAGV